MATKEPSFFADLTPPWATEYGDEARYLELFKHAGDRRAVGEASVAYLTSQTSARRICERYPQAKIIIMLRQPARRAYSLYRFMCMVGAESLPTFEAALAAEDTRATDEALHRELPFWWHVLMYYRLGLYSEQVARYLTQFPREQIKIVLFDEFKRQPLKTTQDIYAFLGVDPTFTPRIDALYESLPPLSLRAQNFVFSRWRLHPWGRQNGPRVVDRTFYPALFVGNLLAGKLRSRALAHDTERALLARYREDIGRTAQITGCDLSRWLSTAV
jgi:hypothetical protein